MLFPSDRGRAAPPSAVCPQIRGEHRPHIAGSAGQAVTLELELKSIADVGLVGFPNAGKSSFLGAISKARNAVGGRCCADKLACLALQIASWFV